MGLRENLIEEAKRVEEDALYSAKGHFSAASVWTNVHWWIGALTAAMAAVAGGSALSRFDSHNEVAGVLAIIVAATTAVMTFLNPHARADGHHRAGNRYNSLRNRARIFHDVDCEAGGADDEITETLKVVARERDELNEESPQIPGWAYRRAKKGIEQGEAAHKVDQDRGV